MNRHRFIQLLSLLLAFSLLLGTPWLVTRINSQRDDFLDNEPVKGMSPGMVLATAALGTFRGLAVDALWYRAEMLKREGKFFDAKALRDLIVTLQPRFAEVWRYQAWDMAYNISVQTGTPQERWDWVHKGIRLLRDEGIPNNPSAVPLYREISWIYLHKIGGVSDDQHWYYKMQVVQEWQELLGAPADGGTTSQVRAQFRPVAEAGERYFLLDRPTREMRDAIADAAARFPAYAGGLEKLQNMSLSRMLPRLHRLSADARDDEPGLAERVDRLAADAQARLDLAGRDPLTRFSEDNPAAAQVLVQAQEAGLSLDAASLRRIGWLLMVSQYSDLARVNEAADQLVERGDMSAAERNVLRFVVAHRGGPAFDAALAFLRAKALVQDYHMDPTTMYALMEQFGPIDWRHWSAHGLYWAYTGVMRGGEIRDRTKFDLLNTDRQVIQALQELFHFGRISYDPFTGQIDRYPDPRYVDEYPKAMQAAIGRQESVEWAGQGNVESFEAGHENFLVKAVQYAYLYGDEAKARQYYREAAETYGNKPHNIVSGRYTLPLEAFVLKELEEDWDTTPTIGAFVESLLLRSFRDGLKVARVDVFNRYTGLARNLHERYQSGRRTATPTAPRERLLLLPFDQLMAEIYGMYMRTPQWNILERAQVYRNTPLPVAQMSYRRWSGAAKQQAEEQGYDGEVMFPPPPGLPDEAQPPATAPRAAPREAPPVELK